MKSKSPVVLLAISFLFSCGSVSLDESSIVLDDSSLSQTSVSASSSVEVVSSLSSSTEGHKKEKPIMVFDIDKDSNTIPEETIDIFLPEFGDKAITINSTLNIYFNGESITRARSLYLYDVNGDGKRDLCTTNVSGSGYWSWYIKVIELETKKELFYIHDRTAFDYYLDIKYDDLIVARCKPGKHTALFEGKFECENDTVFVNWFDPYDIEEIKLGVYLANNELTPLATPNAGNIELEINDADFYYFDFEMICPPKTELPDDDCFLFVDEDGNRAKLTISYVGKTGNTYRYCVKSMVSDEIVVHKISAIFGPNEKKMTIKEVAAVSRKTVSDILLQGKELNSEEIAKVKYSATRSSNDSKNFRNSYVQNRLVNDDFGNTLKFFNQPVFEIGKEFTPSNLYYTYKYSVEFVGRNFIRFDVCLDGIGYLIHIDGTWYGIKNGTVVSNGEILDSFVETPETLSIKTISGDNVVGNVSNLFIYDFIRGNRIDSDFDIVSNSAYYIDSNPKMYISSNKDIYVEGQSYSYKVEDESFFSWINND